MANKIWRVSRILEASPFEDRVINLSEPQMGFILEMYIKDNPDELKLIRGGINNVPPMIFKNWMDVLRGPTLLEFSRNPPAYLKKYHNFEFKK